MSRTAHRLFSSSLRSSQVNLTTAARSPRAAFTRRMMSSESHASHASAPSDRPWIIGSALVFGPLLLYLVSPSARKGSHEHTDHEHKSHRATVEHEGRHAQHLESHREEDVKPIADDEGTEVSGQEVKESMEKAFEADSPKDAQEREEVVAEAVTTTVEENSASETHSQSELSTDATPILESEPHPATAPARVDRAVSAMSDEKVQSTTSDSSEPEVESKV